MQSTKQLYLDQMHLYQTEATPTQIIQDPNSADLYQLQFDQTIFYPQGGGQPSDKGEIHSQNLKLSVEKVEKQSGSIIHHCRLIEGELSLIHQQKVIQLVDQPTRICHSQRHTAGHLLDNALINLNLQFQTIRAYHFPDSPYLEYRFTDQQKIKDPIFVTNLIKQLEAEINNLRSTNAEVQVLNIPISEIQTHCYETNLKFPPSLNQIRIIKVHGNKGCPCGGTHTKSLADLPEIKIPKIKTKGENTRISYNLISQ